MNTHVVGVKGEKLALEYLKKQKYKIVEQNFRCSFGELDIVATDGNYIVFVEVKSRKNDAFGLPRQAVDWRKQKVIVQCAKYWLSSNKKTGMPCRFDVVEILGDQITLLKDAFRA